MPVAARCPSCAAPLSETSVLALAPLCTHCGVVIISVGGTLGLTGAYGVSDPTIERRRVEADLAVLRDYQVKYQGMKQACLEQLAWGPERYAQLPSAPQLLLLQPLPPFWNPVGWLALLVFVGYLLPLLSSITLIYLTDEALKAGQPEEMYLFAESAQLSFLPVFNWMAFNLLFFHDIPVVSKIFLFWTIIYALLCLGPFTWILGYFRVQAANGDRPRENARRAKLHQDAVASAMKAAESRKAAEDHRLRSQIQDLESLAKTVGGKEADVRQLLAAL